MLTWERPSHVTQPLAYLEVDGVQGPRRPPPRRDAREQQRATEHAHPGAAQSVDRVSVAPAPTLSLHIRLDLEPAALQDADMDAPRAELAGEGDAGRAGADHAHVSADVLAVGLGRVPVHRAPLRRPQDLPILAPPPGGSPVWTGSALGLLPSPDLADFAWSSAAQERFHGLCSRERTPRQRPLMNDRRRP